MVTHPTTYGSAPAYGYSPGANPAYQPTYGSYATQARPASNRTLVIILASVFGGIALLVLCCVVAMAVAINRSSIPPQTEYANLLDARRDMSTKLVRYETADYPVPAPPTGMFNVEHYSSPAGQLAAYVSPSPGDGQKHPAMIWIFGGFSNSISETAWEPVTPDNDQSARAFREAGIIMMHPSLRGGNTNPGHIEGFYGEVDDALAAAEYLAAKDYVDPQRIYLGGHSTGGTLVMLVAAASDRFRAVFALGPVDDVSGYGGDVLPFNTWDKQELALRSPIGWLHAMNGPVFVFEGSVGNISCLRAMRRSSTNPELHFHEVRRGDHFNIIAPVTRMIAEKVRQDTGPSCNIQFTDDEINRLF